MPSPLAPLDSKTVDGVNYGAYIVTDDGTFVLIKTQGNLYTYRTITSEVSFEEEWQHVEDLEFTSKAPANINFNIIILQRGLMNAGNGGGDSPLPTAGGLTEMELRSQALQVTGDFYPEVQKVSVQENPLPENSATEQKQNIGNEYLQDLSQKLPHAIDGKLPVVLQWPESFQVAGNFWPDVQPISGKFWQEVQPVSGKFWQDTQPVSGNFWPEFQQVLGPLTDSQLRANPIPVSVSFPNNQAVTVSNPVTEVSISNLPAKQLVEGEVVVKNFPTPVSLTDTQLRATPLKVTVENQQTTNGLTDSQLRAAPLPVSISNQSTPILLRKVTASTVGTTPTVVKSSGGSIYTIHVFNKGNVPVYLNLYNKASAPSTNDIPVEMYGVPAADSVRISWDGYPAIFSTGISYTITSTSGLLGSLVGLLVAGDVVVNIHYT